MSTNKARDVVGRRVLVLLNTADDAAGGNLRAAVNLAEAMVGTGDDVTFTAPVGPELQRRTVDLMDPRVEIRLFRASAPLLRFGGSVRQAWWIWRSVRRFDEVQTHSVFTLSAVYSIVICALRGVPVVMWPHSSLDPFDLRKHSRAKRMLGPFLRRLLDRCAGIFFTAEQERENAETWGSRVPRHVVPLPVPSLDISGCDPDAWRSRHGIPLGVPVVLNLGRIDYKKRIPLLVETFAQVEIPNARLVLVGDGPSSERELVAAAAARHGVTDRIHITGWLEGADRVEAFAAATVFALLSDMENFGLAVVEAMSAGVPVVVSDQIALAPDLVAADAAVVVPRDPAVAAAAIERLLRYPDTALGRRGQEFVETRFAPAAVAARLSELSGPYSGRGGPARPD